MPIQYKGKRVTFTDVDGDNPAQFFGIPTGTNETVPPGWQLIERTAIIRLGANMHIHTAGGHGSLGVTSVSAVVNGGENALYVTTDFDSTRELILSAIAEPDYTLNAKRILPAGGSGGGAQCYFRISSETTLSAGSATYAAGTALKPTSNIFRSDVDNLWVRFLSLRRLV